MSKSNDRFMEFTKENNPFHSNSGGEGGRVYLSISRVDMEAFLKKEKGEVITFMGTVRGNKASNYAIKPNVWLGNVGCKVGDKYEKN